MFAHAGLTTEKYSLPVYPVLINILPSKGNLAIANSYQTEFARLRTLVEYRVIKLLDRIFIANPPDDDLFWNLTRLPNPHRPIKNNVLRLPRSDPHRARLRCRPRNPLGNCPQSFPTLAQ